MPSASARASAFSASARSLAEASAAAASASAADRRSALLRELLLGLHELLPRALELALEVIELRLALVEREPAEPDLLLGARQPVLGRLLRVLLDAVGELDRRPDELESLEPCRAVVCGEARAAAEIERRRGREEPFELRKRNDVGAGLRFVLQELAFVPLNRIHGFLFRAAQA